MSVPYTDSEASEARQWSNRYGPPNAWTASLGTAARMIGRLLDERERLMAKQTVMAPGDDYIREWHEEFQRWKAVAEDKQDLRDHFAASALTGLLASREWPIDSDEAAHYCYRVADAMLRERGNHIPDAGKMVESSDEKYRAWVAQNAALVKAAKEKSAPRTPQADRLAEWERHGSHRWGLGVAADLYDLERRVAALEKANHDAAPAATASLPTADHDVCRQCRGRESGCGTGDTQEPVAWAVMDGHEVMEFCADKEEAKHAAGVYGDCHIVPLYRHPQLTLTDAQRAAVADAADRYAALTPESCETADTLRGLLEPMGGER